MANKKTDTITEKRDLKVLELRKDFKHWFYIVNYDGQEHRVKLFDYQKEQPRHPEVIKCLIKKNPDGTSSVQQDLIPLIAARYIVGSVHLLTLRRSQERPGQYDAYGPEGFRFHLDNTRDKTYRDHQVVPCRITNIDGIKVNVEEEDTVAPDEDIVADLITPDALNTIARASAINPLVIKVAIKAFRNDPLFFTARQSLKNGQPQWISEALDVISANMGRWLTTHVDTRPRTAHRRLLLKELKRICIEVLERSGLVAGDSPRVRQMRSSLSDCIALTDEFSAGLQLLKEKTRDGLAIVSYVNDLLASLERTGYVYEPSHRLGTLTCAMSLDPSLMDSVIHKMFDILISRPLSDWQHDPLRSALVRLLDNYTATQADKADRVMDLSLGQNKAIISDTVRSIAFSLLLTSDDDETVNRHALMSQLCRYATLFQTNLAATLNGKAYGNLLTNTPIKLPFSWPDLQGSSDVICFKVSQASTPQASAEPRLYEGRLAKVNVAGNSITISPTAFHNQLRDALPAGTFSWRDIKVKVGSRDFIRDVKADSDDIQQLRQMWRDIEDSLLDAQDEIHHTAQLVIPKRKKIAVSEGDEVLIRVTGASGTHESNGNPLFHVVVVDDQLSGEGFISPRDIVHYNVLYAHISDFLDEQGKPLLLRAVVRDATHEGDFKFDLQANVDTFVSNYAKSFCDTDDQILCRMTITYKGGNLLISSEGFSLKVPYGPDVPTLNNGDLIWVEIKNVYSNGNVDGKFIEFADDTEQLSDSDCFHNLLLSYSEGKVYEPSDTDEQDEPDDDDEQDDAQSHDDLSRDEVTELMNIADRQSTMTNSRSQTFNLLAIARLLALATDNRPRADEYHERMTLIAMMEGYARNQWIDPDDFDRHYNRSINMLAGNPDMRDHAMRLFCLSRLERGGAEDRILNVINQCQQSVTGNIARLVLAYNMTNGFSLTSVRRDIRSKINELLGIKTTDESDREYMGEEGPTLEFKESMVFPPDNNMRPDRNRQTNKLLTVICGMMNTKGGRLLVGVNDSGLAIGLHTDFAEFSGTENYDEQKSRDLMSNFFTSSMIQHMPRTASLYADTCFEIHGGRMIFVVDTRPTPLVMDVDGIAYRRIGTSTRPMDPDEINIVQSLKNQAAK